MNKKILDLGAGAKKNHNAMKVDINPKVNPDIVHDLNNFPYPFEDQYFDEIIMDNVIGELNDFFKVMDEIYRIAKVGAQITISVPYFRSSYGFIHPNIKSFFTIRTFEYFDPNSEIFKVYKYSDSTFQLVSLNFNEDFKSGLIKTFVRYVANKNPSFYERILSHLIPLEAITFRLKKI